MMSLQIMVQSFVPASAPTHWICSRLAGIAMLQSPSNLMQDLVAFSQINTMMLILVEFMLYNTFQEYI